MSTERRARMWCRVICWMLGSSMLVSNAAAQATSGINGRVTDSTAAALPGVTVTITSPALQVPSLTTVTGADGSYRFIQLPAGTYQARFELAGFRPAVRTEIQLTVGFIATINMALELGGIEESVTVSGASPVVDTTNTRVTSTLPVETLSTIPNGRRVGDIGLLTPGIMVNTAPNPTALGLFGMSGGTVSGGFGTRFMTDGLDQIDTGSGNPDMGANVQELNVTFSGGTADVAQAGVYINIVSKSGGNEFRGRYASLVTGHALESDNLDDELRRQRFAFTNETRYFVDSNGDLGGRIVRDRLWFYGSIRDRRNKVAYPGFAFNAGPDGRYGTGDEPAFLPSLRTDTASGKLSYQMTTQYQMSALYALENDTDSAAIGSAASRAVGSAVPRFTPYEASGILKYTPRTFKVEVKGTPRNNLLFTWVWGRDGSHADYSPQPGQELIPAARDLATQIFTGQYFPQDNRVHSRFTSKADVTFLPSHFLGIGGAHELRAGFRQFSAYVDTVHVNDPAGNYLLIFDTIGGVLHQPSQIDIYNYPTAPHSLASGQSAYFTDRWAFGSRLTTNFGFRWDRYHAWLPAQTKEAGPFSVGATFPERELNTWNMPAPRAGFAYNLTSDAKTVVKGTYGWFNDELNARYSIDYNPNADVITTYRWHDLNRNNNYDPGDVNLDPNGPDFLSRSGGSSNLLNPDLKYPHTHELTASLERELLPGMGLRTLYIWRRISDGTFAYNVLRPYSAFNIGLSRRDPGPDGLVNTSDDGPTVKVSDFAAAYRGAAFVGSQRTTVPDSRDNTFQVLQVTLTKRAAGRWGAATSVSGVKNHRWIAPIPESPNEEYNPLDETWDWTIQTNGSYVMPLDIRVAALATFQSGTAGQRTYIFRAADPLGGPSLVQQSTVTLRLEPFGAERGPVRKVVNIRVSKLLRVGVRRTLELNFDVNNVINSNAAWTSTYQSGPTFGFATAVYQPRLMQFGAAFEF